MKTMRMFALAALIAAVPSAYAKDGVLILQSPYGVGETMDRLEKVVKERGLKVFARIDHAAGAASVGKSLRPTQLIIFGNPQGGTPFMECAQSVGIDLPLKALAWEDESAQVWLGYNDPAFIGMCHGVPECPVIEKLRKALAGMTEASVAR